MRIGARDERSDSGSSPGRRVPLPPREGPFRRRPSRPASLLGGGLL